VSSVTPARTPIAGVPYRWAEATGHHELLLLERDAGLRTAVELVAARSRGATNDPLDAAALPVGDIDTLLTELRAAVLGDRLLAEGHCPACGAAVDVDFGLQAFREHRAPRRPRGARPTGEPGWWALERHAAEFRLPTAGDVLAAQETTSPAAALAAVCVRSTEAADGDGEVPRGAIKAAERAMEALAPTLRDDVEGCCPDCGVTVALDVDVRELCLAELRFLAHAVLEDVHVLAGAYGWTEQTILDLPTRRRTAYAEMIRASRGAPLSVEAFLG
jgi:hypothetical protein